MFKVIKYILKSDKNSLNKFCRNVLVQAQKEQLLMRIINDTNNINMLIWKFLYIYKQL